MAPRRTPARGSGSATATARSSTRRSSITGSFSRAIPGTRFFPAGGYTGNESTDLVDVNNDGKLDIVWVVRLRERRRLDATARGCGSGTATARGSTRPSRRTDWPAAPASPSPSAGGLTANESTHLVDIDKDGFVDLVWIYDAGRHREFGRAVVEGQRQRHVPDRRQPGSSASAAVLASRSGAQGGQTGNETTRVLDVNRDGNLDVLWIWDAQRHDRPVRVRTSISATATARSIKTPLVDVGASETRRTSPTSSRAVSAAPKSRSSAI